MTLASRTRNQKLIGDLQVAESFIARGVGLLGHSSLGDGQAMWIHRCNNIHTFFMRFAIDCVFVDKDLRVVDLFANVQPWRARISWGADSVFEMKAGSIARLQIQKGEEFHVGA